MNTPEPATRMAGALDAAGVEHLMGLCRKLQNAAYSNGLSEPWGEQSIMDSAARSDQALADLQQSILDAIGYRHPAAAPAVKPLTVAPPGMTDDTARLDFVLEKWAFVVWCNRDGSIKQCQLMTQSEDEEYIALSGADRFFNTERDAIDAAMRATPAAGTAGEARHE